MRSPARVVAHAERHEHRARRIDVDLDEVILETSHVDRAGAALDGVAVPVGDRYEDMSGVDR